MPEHHHGVRSTAGAPKCRAGGATRVRHQARITPYTPRHNGKVERYNRIIAEEFPYTRTRLSEDQRRQALGVWNCPGPCYGLETDEATVTALEVVREAVRLDAASFPLSWIHLSDLACTG
jgi:hypothetical protein